MPLAACRLIAYLCAALALFAPSAIRAAESAAERGRSLAETTGESWADKVNGLRDPADNIHVNSWLRNEILVRTSSPHAGSAISQRNEANLQIRYSLMKGISFYAWLRPFYDSVYDWGGFGSLTGSNGPTFRNKWGNNFDLGGNKKDPWAREFYVDLKYQNFWARIGRQFVSWGKSDGVYLLDNINPFTYREPLKFQEEEIKIPQFMINLNYRFGTVGSVQFLMLPDPEFAQFPGRDPLQRFTGQPNCGHDFEFPVACLTNQAFVAFDQFFKDNGIVGANGQPGFPFPNTREPPHTLENAAYMVRFDSAVGPVTYSLAYEYKYNQFLFDLPDIGDHKGTVGKGMAILGIGNVRRPQRIHIIGGAADYQFAWFPILGERTVLRAETGGFLEDLFYAPNFDLIKKDHYQILIGLDKFAPDPGWLDFPRLGFGPSSVPWFVSIQVFQDWILHPDKFRNAYVGTGSNNFDFNTGKITNGLRDANQTYVTFFLGKDVLADQSLNIEQFFAVDPNFDAYWEHIQFKYVLTDFVSLILGYNKTWGTRTSFYGGVPSYVWFATTIGI